MDDIRYIRALYRIALSIGLSIDLDTMLEKVLLSFRDNLELSSCGVLFFKVDADGKLFLETKHSVPQSEHIRSHYEAAMRRLLSGDRDTDIRRFENRLPLSMIDKKKGHLYLFNLPYVGVLILEKNDAEFYPGLVEAIRPLSDRLAAACTACIQSLELEMVTEGTRTINRDLSESEKLLMTMVGRMRRAHDELDANRNHLALILQSLGDGIIVADRTGRIDMMNVKALEYLDYMPEAAADITFDSLFSNTRGGFDPVRCAEAAEYSENHPCEMTIVNRRGIERQIRVTANRLDTLLPGEQEIIYLLQDITREKEIDRMKNDFISNLSHEMRTPMNAILGISRMLGHRDAANLTTRQSQGLSLIYDSGSRLLALINDILDLSKLEAGKMDVVPRKFRPVELLDNIKEFVAPLQSESVDFHLEADRSLPLFVVADDSRIRQVLVNILGNSFKFTEKGSVHLAVSAKNGFLSFAVSDTGIGIPEKDLSFIFERFKQLDSSPSRRFGGTGIGLSLSKDLVILMGGTITAESGLGQGTTMRFSIPYIEAAAEDSGIVESGIDGEKETPRMLRRKILVAEDEAAGRETLTFILSGDYDLVFAADGARAADLFSSEHPDLVLMDIMMPGVDGFSALERIRELPGGRAVPVIAVTARAMKDEREKILAKGFDGYVSKPVDGELLLQTIRSRTDVLDRIL